MQSPASATVFLLPLTFGLGAFLAVVFFLDPGSGYVAPVLFYLSFLVLAASLLTILGVFSRRNTNTPGEIIAVSFRQGILLASLLVILLILQHSGWLFWWSGIMAILAVVFLESALN